MDAAASVDAIPYMHGQTNTAAALSFLYRNMFKQQNGDRPNAPNIVVIMTDGASNNHKDTQKEAFKVGK